MANYMGYATRLVLLTVLIVLLIPPGFSNNEIEDENTKEPLGSKLSSLFITAVRWNGFSLMASLLISFISILFACVFLIGHRKDIAIPLGVAGLLGLVVAGWLRINSAFPPVLMSDKIMVITVIIIVVLLGAFASLSGYIFYHLFKKKRKLYLKKRFLLFAIPSFVSIFLLLLSYNFQLFPEITKSHPKGIPITNRAVTEVIAENLSFPTALTVAPDGRIFFSEFRTGLIGVLTPTDDGKFTKSNFATVPLPEGMSKDQGLWGIAYHPEKSYLYSMATDKVKPLASSHVVRFRDNGF